MFGTIGFFVVLSLAYTKLIIMAMYDVSISGKSDIPSGIPLLDVTPATHGL